MITAVASAAMIAQQVAGKATRDALFLTSFDVIARRSGSPSKRCTRKMRAFGTALECLETVLPDEIQDAVWPFLGEARPMRLARPANEILADSAERPRGVGGAT